MTRLTIFAERPMDIYRKSDTGLIIGVILLWGLGLLTVYVCSAGYGLRAFGDSQYFIKRQVLLSLAGIAVCICCASIKMDFIRKLLPLIYIGSVILCLLAFVPGVASPRNGAHRWINVPFTDDTFQPSELAKVAVILFLANWFDKHGDLQGEERPSLMAPIVGLCLVVAIVMFQDDFSTALFILLIGLLMFFMAGAQVLKLVPFVFLAVVAMLLFVFTSPFRVNRVIAFLNPEYDTHGFNYQTAAARTAISDGGLLGQGFGAGLDKINRVPEIQTDYIFAGWAEAMGFIGVLGYFLLLLFVSWRAYKVAFCCNNKFGALTAFGAASCLLIQSLLNCGVVCGGLPATGITLPFFSYGGSSLVISFCLCGLLINLSRRQNTDQTDSDN